MDAFYICMFLKTVRFYHFNLLVEWGYEKEVLIFCHEINGMNITTRSNVTNRSV